MLEWFTLDEVRTDEGEREAGDEIAIGNCAEER
jgi:hypothetical protein